MKRYPTTLYLKTLIPTETDQQRAMPPQVIPADLKTIKAYIKRAEELDLDRSTPTSRLVAYYCRQFAVERGLTANATSSESKSCLMQIMDELEKERELIGNGFSREEAYTICLDFAQVSECGRVSVGE